MKPKVIYVMSIRSTFVEADLSILSKRYELIVNTYQWHKKGLAPFFMLHQLWVLLTNSFSTKLIIISSGGYWSLIPTLFGKFFSIPVFIILNGSDCASLPWLKYGNLRTFFLRAVCRISYTLAEILLPVSDSLVMTKNDYYLKNHIDYQGYKYFFPNINTKYQIIFNGFDVDFWKMDSRIEKEKDSFFAAFSPSQYLLKGGDLIVSVARRFPHCNFYIAGLNQPQVATNLSPNIRFLGFLDPIELRTYYQKCQFHFQLSVFEGFGCTLCEAMLCQCIPIGSEVNIIPKIIGDTGLILKHRDIDLLEMLVNKALSLEDRNEQGANARQRIVDNFHIHFREEQLFSLIEQRLG